MFKNQVAVEGRINQIKSGKLKDFSKLSYFVQMEYFPHE